MKWAKSDEFSDFHTAKFGVKMSPQGRRRRLLAKMGAPSHRLAATDDDAFGVFENKVVSSNPLTENSLIGTLPRLVAHPVR